MGEHFRRHAAKPEDHVGSSLCIMSRPSTYVSSSCLFISSRFALRSSLLSWGPTLFGPMPPAQRSLGDQTIASSRVLRPTYIRRTCLSLLASLCALASVLLGADPFSDPCRRPKGRSGIKPLRPFAFLDLRIVVVLVSLSSRISALLLLFSEEQIHFRTHAVGPEVTRG